MKTGRHQDWRVFRLMIVLSVSLPVLQAHAAPKAPTNLVATAVFTEQINLSWTDTPNNEHGFKIERAPDLGGAPGTWTQIAIVGPNVTNYSDTTAASDTKYGYRVRAYNNSGDSAYSNQATATTFGIDFLTVTPAGGLTSSGFSGGPFSPASQVYALINRGSASLSWATGNGQDWVSLSPASGALAVGASRSMTESIDSNANGLVAGSYSDSVVFANLTNAIGSTNRDVNLTVNPVSPVANFFASPRYGLDPLTVTFTDISSGSITNRNWNFGDGLTTNTTMTSLTHTYEVPTSNTVTLIVNGPAGVGAKSLTNSIIVAAFSGTNSWINSSNGKWEVGASWSLTVPPDAGQSATFLTNANTKVVTIDATTSANFPGTLTISNLVVSAPVGSTNTLQLTDAGTSTPLRIFNLLNVNNGGAISISNSALQVDQMSKNSNVVNGVISLPSGSLVALGTTTVGSTNNSDGKLLISGGTAMISNLTLATIGSSTGTVTVTSGTLSVTNGANNSAITIGAFGVGQMSVAGGAVSTRAAYVAGGATSAGGVGTLTVSGGTFSPAAFLVAGRNPGHTGTIWVAGGNLSVNGLGIGLTVGQSGDGSMVVSNGTVTTLVLNVGNGNTGRGTFTAAGGTTTVQSYLSICPPDGATGAVWVTGGTITVTNDANSITYVGQSSDGQMTISNGTFTTRSLWVATVNQHESVLRIAGGTVSVLANMTIALISHQGSTTGTVWMTGGQLLMPDGSLTNGGFGAGRMIVSNGQAVARDFVIAGNADSRSSLTVAGGSITALAGLTVGDCASNAVGQVLIGGGSIYVTNAAHTAVLNLRSGTLTFNSGTLQVDTLVITNSCARFIRTGGTLIVSNVVLATNLDADGDGLPNGWEQAHGLDPLNAADANVDGDGDGFFNLQEYLAGTNPTNASSAFRVLSLESTNGDVLVTWRAGGGRTNVVQSAANLAGSYSNVSPNIVLPGSGDVTTNYLDAGAATNAAGRFYRIRLVP